MNENRTDSSDLPSEGKETIERLIWRIKQRWILRLIIIYGMCFWLVVQACAATFGSLGVPDGMLKRVVLAGLAGLPITMMLAWGLRVTLLAGRTPNPDQPDHIEQMSLPFFLGLIVATCLLIFLLILQTWTPGATN